MSMDASKQQVYKPRSGTVNRNLDKYTKEMLQFVYDEIEPYAHMFGYTKGDPHAEKTNTEFFDYQGKASHKSQDLKSHYLKLNETAWKRRFDMKAGKQEFKPYPINQGKEGIRIFEEFDILSYSNPMDKIELI